jgi:uracil-DNA glycosylase
VARRSPVELLPQLHQRIVACAACPRLVAWREEVGRTKRRMYRGEEYWARPVPGFGDPDARLLLIGLAPGAHGANRTGRAFTGDKSGEFLYAALHRAGYANQPSSTGRGDGLALRDAFVSLPVRCVPPDNRPTPQEIARCAPFFDQELLLLRRARVVLALGAIAWNAFLDRCARARPDLRGTARTVATAHQRPRPAFAHGEELPLPELSLTLLGSYHVSQQNTQTGRLTAAMFDAILDRARHLSGV